MTGADQTQLAGVVDSHLDNVGPRAARTPPSRRTVLAGMLAAGAVALVPARSLGRAGAIGVANGGLLQGPDANGWRLLAGYPSKLLAVTGASVPGTGFRWHVAPDGGGVVAWWRLPTAAGHMSRTPRSAGGVAARRNLAQLFGRRDALGDVPDL